MGRTIIVTTGQNFTDIDALACAIAYTQLLDLRGKNAKAVLPGTLNKSVTSKINKWQLDFSSSTITKPSNYSYVLVDISDLDNFAKFVRLENIIEIYDHRKGYENFWKEKLGKNSHIEMVGACATLIWEEFKKVKLESKISTVSANLLYTAIVSNTLYFKATVTTERDVRAFEEIKTYTDLPNDWIETYFSDQDREVANDIFNSIINDTKNIDPIMGQLELWNSKEIIKNNLAEIEKALLSFGKNDWFLTSPSISEGINYLFTKNPDMRKLLEKTLDAKFDGFLGKTKKLWLRKEIVLRIRKSGELIKN